MDFEFFITSMPASRPADYYLGALGGAVFIDFNNKEGKVTLKRISFDGFGCCEPGTELEPLPPQSAVLFLSMMQTKEIDQADLGRIIKGTLGANRKHLWQDALEHYKFI